MVAVHEQRVGQIILSYSDDRAHSWSNPKVINGGAAFCPAGSRRRQCDDNQFSTPTVNPTTGFLYVAFENFDTADENQYLGVRSNDGGQTIQGPFFVSPVFDVNYPRTNRTDCLARGSGWACGADEHLLPRQLVGQRRGRQARRRVR